MNVLLFASSYRSYSALQNVYLELSKRNIPTFFLFSTSSDVAYPTHQIETFEYDTNVQTDFSNGYLMESVGLNIPFKPDVVILARERWHPEQGIIHEAKNKFKSKVYVIEVSSHIINNIENRLEMYSRNYRYPQSMVDGYFEHSQYAKERRIDCLYKEWEAKSIVVGNPRFDKLHDIREEECIKKYNVDLNKKRILFWGIINTSRTKSFDLLKKMKNELDNGYQIFYKPNPQEPSNPIFKHQFNPFLIDGVTVIKDDYDTNTISKLCDIHIASISSVCQYSFYFNKKLCILNDACNIEEYTNDYNRYFKELKEGVEDSAKFWMGVFGIQSYQEFKDLIGLDRLEIFNKTNQDVIAIARNSVTMCDTNLNFVYNNFHTKDEFIKLFDEYNDNKASVRIVDYLQNNI